VICMPVDYHRLAASTVIVFPYPSEVSAGGASNPLIPITHNEAIEARVARVVL
jgi:hypothetical protein